MPDVVLHTEHLTKRYGALVAVKDLTLDVYEGEVLGFLGPNGAGKTTSINMMCGLLRPDAGRLTVLGMPIMDGDGDVRAHVGVCPQDIVLYPRLTCSEQLQFMGEMYGLKRQVAHQRSECLLDALDLVEKRDRQAHTLSGGMQRRLNLAMALVHDPDIVVLDEPEAGLDPQSRVKVREYIRSLARHKTVILTTHNMDEADRLADRIAIIDHGELLVLNTPDALKRSVGEGDVLEIDLEEQADDSQKVKEALAPLFDQPTLNIAGHTVTVHARGVAQILPILLGRFSSAQIRCREVRLRQSTLEDVFIQLTGRGLRE